KQPTSLTRSKSADLGGLGLGLGLDSLSSHSRAVSHSHSRDDLPLAGPQLQRHSSAPDSVWHAQPPLRQERDYKDSCSLSHSHASSHKRAHTDSDIQMQMTAQRVAEETVMDDMAQSLARLGLMSKDIHKELREHNSELGEMREEMQDAETSMSLLQRKIKK